MQFEYDFDQHQTLSTFEPTHLRFSTPRSRWGDSKLCLAKARGNGGQQQSQSIRVVLRGATVAKVGHVHNSVRTIVLSDIAGDFGDFLLQLDAHAVDVTKRQMEAWFMHKMDDETIDDYYRECATSMLGFGSVARFFVDASTDVSALAAAASTADRVDLEFRLEGLLFRSQLFAMLWKCRVCHRAPPDERPTSSLSLVDRQEQHPADQQQLPSIDQQQPPADQQQPSTDQQQQTTDRQHPPADRQQPQQRGEPAAYAFVPDEDGDAADDEDGPAGGDVEDLRARLLERANDAVAGHTDALKKLRRAMRMLGCKTRALDLDMLSQLEELLQTAMDVAPSRRSTYNHTRTEY